MDNYIKLKEKKDIFKLGIVDENGNVVKDSDGNEICLEFDLADINLPLRYNKCVNDIKKAKINLKNQIIIIDKKQDKKRKNSLSVNEELKAKAVERFFYDTEKAMDLFLGKDGTKKFLNGRSPYWEMFDDLSEAIEPYMEKMKLSVNDMTNRIKEKYKIKESDILKNE